MREEQAQQTLTIWAFEEADRDRQLLTARGRSSATRKAFEGACIEEANSPEASETVIVRRAALLVTTLQEQVPSLSGILHLTRFVNWPVPTAVIISLVIGIMTNALGFQRQINLLSFPLFILLAWNLGYYLVHGLFLFARPWAGHHSLSGIFGGFASLLFRGIVWSSALSRKHFHKGSKADSSIIAEALTRFGILWFRHAGPLLGARLRRALHLGAIAMIVGVVGGMYVRGLAFEYRVTWESTLLDADNVQWLLGIVLGPAARFLGVTVPDVIPLRGPGASGDAVIWIHLFSITALLVVFIPRAALALYAWWRSFMLARSVPVDLENTYFHRLLTGWRGTRTRVQIAPYCFRPDAGTLDALQSLLFDYFGARADIQVHDPLPYGTTADGFLAQSMVGESDHERDCLVVLLNMAQSPEVEVHGTLLEQLKATIQERGGWLIVVIDVTKFRARIDAPERFKDRQRAWERIARELKINTIEFSEAAAGADITLQAVHDALWPTPKSTPGQTAGGEF